MPVKKPTPTRKTKSKPAYVSAEDIIRIACNPCEPHGLSTRPGYYSGRGPNRGDLNEGHLEKLHATLKEKVNPEAAQEFCRTILKLDDLSATNVLQELYRFCDNGCKTLKEARKGVYLTGHGQAVVDDAYAHVIGAIMAPQRDHKTFEGQSIKWAFLQKHMAELPKGTKMKPFATHPYGGMY